jgi:hypothetical protein
MYRPLSSIKFFDGIEQFTAEEHLQDKDNIVVKDGDSFLALKRTKTLARLMKDVHDCPIIDEETYEICYQATMTLFYRTIDTPDELKQITFPYDPSVFNNYSIFHFIHMGSFPFLDDGIMYRVGDLLCYTVDSWGASSCRKLLVMGVVPMVGEVPPIQIPPIQIPPIQIPVQIPVQIPDSEPIENNPPNGGEVDWPEREEVVLE